MKIATWNVERLDHPRKLGEILDCCHRYDTEEFGDEAAINLKGERIGLFCIRYHFRYLVHVDRIATK